VPLCCNQASAAESHFEPPLDFVNAHGPAPVCYNFCLHMTKFAIETSLSPKLLAKYEVVIGLEVHAQLLTKTKIFCGCSTRFGDPPNSNVCPVCLGLPGTLPVLNKRAVEMGMRAALALNSTVHEHSRFRTCRKAIKSPNTSFPSPRMAGSRSSTTARRSASA